MATQPQQQNTPQKNVYQKKPLPEKPHETKHGHHHISNVEWGLVIGALLVVDILQIVLDIAFQSGVVINRFIDVFVGLSFGLYLQIRGQSLNDMKRLMALVGTFIGEEIPDADALPFWTLDGLYMMSLSKTKDVIKKVPGGATALRAVTYEPKKPTVAKDIKNENLLKKNDLHEPTKRNVLDLKQEKLLHPADKFNELKEFREDYIKGSEGKSTQPKKESAGKTIDSEQARKRLEEYRQENDTDKAT